MEAIGASAQDADGAMRISLGIDTTEEDIRTAALRIPAAYARYIASLEH